MTVEVFEKDMERLVEPAAELEHLANGFQWTEGPVWDFSQGVLYFSDISGNVIHRYRNGEVEVYREPSQFANGLTFDHEGRLVSCEHRTRRLTREVEGELEVLVDSYGGERLNAPNDVIVAGDGSVIFTDPHYGLTEGYGGPAQHELDVRGVYLLPPGAHEPKLLVDDFEGPNGLVLTPDEQVLYVDDSERGHIRSFGVSPDWKLSGGEVLVELGDDGEGVPDGLKLDIEGNIYCTGPGGIWVCSVQGEVLGRIRTPEIASNLAWGDQDARTMYITAATGLYRIRSHSTGHVPYRRS